MTPRKVRVLYFAALRELAGAGEEALELPQEVITAADLLAWLPRRHAALEGRLCTVRVALDECFADGHDPIADGATVALIPPVQGG